MDELEKLRAEVERLHNEEWNHRFSCEAKYRCEAYKELLDFIDSLDKPENDELPKWRKIKNQQPCWSGEISVDPINRLFRYENYVINADQLFKAKSLWNVALRTD